MVFPATFRVKTGSVIDRVRMEKFAPAVDRYRPDMKNFSIRLELDGEANDSSPYSGRTLNDRRNQRFMGVMRAMLPAVTMQ